MRKAPNNFWFICALACFLAAGVPGCGLRRPPPDELVIALEANPNNFDPRFARDIYSDNVNKLIYDGLFRLDRDGKLTPRLAELYAMESPTTVHIKLAPGKKFHDGRPFRAQDVVWTLESIRGEKSLSPLKGNFEIVDHIEEVNGLEVKIYLKRPSASFLNDLTVGIVPSGSGPEALKTAPVGTGPYRLLDYEPSEKVRLIASDNGNWPAPGVKKVTLAVVPNETSRVLGLLHGSIDLAVNNITPLYADYLKKLGYPVETQAGTNFSYLGFNLRDPALSKPQVREAFARGIQRDRLVKYRLRGMATVATGYLPFFHWAYRKPAVDYTYDPGTAKNLLAGAGYPDGLDLEWKTSTNKEAIRNIEAMKEDLAACGIRVTVKSYEWATLYEQVQTGRFQVFGMSWVGITDPDMMYSIFHSHEIPRNNGKNRGFYSNPRVDELLDLARPELDPLKRKEYYGEVQEILAKDLPYVPLYWRDNIVVHRPQVTDVDVDPSGNFWFVEKVRKGT